MQGIQAKAGEFLCALSRRYTYDARHNAYFRFGVLWGVPVPIFALTLDMHLSAVQGRTLASIIGEHPIHVLFLAHPLLFGVVFGAMGSMRLDLDRENRRLIARLSDLAMTDSLTDLCNRRCVLEGLRQALGRADRGGEPVAVVLFDLDGFKAINERRGHLAGDRVLGDVADALRSVLRCSDVLGRYGGDEFLLVMTRDTAGAERVVARAEQAVRARTGLGLSAGVARWPEDGRGPDALVAAADARLGLTKVRRRARPRSGRRPRRTRVPATAP